MKIFCFILGHDWQCTWKSPSHDFDWDKEDYESLGCTKNEYQCSRCQKTKIEYTGEHDSSVCEICQRRATKLCGGQDA